MATTVSSASRKMANLFLSNTEEDENEEEEEEEGGEVEEKEVEERRCICICEGDVKEADDLRIKEAVEVRDEDIADIGLKEEAEEGGGGEEEEDDEEDEGSEGDEGDAGRVEVDSSVCEVKD